MVIDRTSNNFALLSGEKGVRESKEKKRKKEKEKKRRKKEERKREIK